MDMNNDVITAEDINANQPDLNKMVNYTPSIETQEQKLKRELMNAFSNISHELTENDRSSIVVDDEDVVVENTTQELERDIENRTFNSEQEILQLLDAYAKRLNSLLRD